MRQNFGVNFDLVPTKICSHTPQIMPTKVFEAPGRLEQSGKVLSPQSLKSCFFLFIGRFCCVFDQHLEKVQKGQGHLVTSHLGDNMASVTWATKVSTKWVDQIDQLTNLFEGVSILLYGSVASLPPPSSNIEAWQYGTSLRFALLLHLGHEGYVNIFGHLVYGTFG